MIWPLRALIGPMIWAAAFAVIYAVHGYGCAVGWPDRAAPIGDLHRFTLVILWLIALGAAAAVCLAASPRPGTEGRIVRIADRIGLVATLATLFPVIGVSTCG